MDMAARTRNHQNQPIRARSEQRQRQVMLAARVNTEEERRIRAAAKAQQISVASLIRQAVLAAVEEPGAFGDHD
jgi:predicted HicB family RNase H-like nuclease